MQVKGSAAALTGHSKSNSAVYKAQSRVQVRNYFTEIPCGVCPVISNCFDGGVISPQTCEYMKQWLNLPDEEELF